ncbi:WD40/YVTN/BNR-like repeat-containing protein [Winogradskyella sp.]|uniref:WD40/YVTN/BNR-like repeat-containing protein n=3 Tax=Winogradskyella sp. TaxID=1883156 RepID=UPI003511292A
MKKLIVLLIITVFSSQLRAQSASDSIITSLKKHYKLTEFDRPSIQIKFNNDTIIVAGYLQDLSSLKLSYQRKKNIVYKTSNGGLNWKQIKFAGDAWIYDTFHKKDGKIWMGGSDNYIHYSSDFGETWGKKPKPFNPVNRVLSIFMADSLNGIAGGLSNGLAITKDNWSTSKQIETPIDQGKFKILNPSARDRIDEIALVDSIILINQNDYIFYSKRDSINWTKFNIPVSGFSINQEKSEITLHSRNGKLFVLDKKLNLIKERQEDYLWETIKSDCTKLNLQSFFGSEISSISLTSTKWLFDKRVHMGAIYKSDIQKGRILDKKGNLIFKSKGFAEKSLEISKDDIQTLLQDKNLKVKLAELSKHLKFTTNDLNDYKIFVEGIKKERIEKESWGGNFTSQIELTNPEFQEFQNQSSYLKQNYISSVFNQVYLPFFLGQEEIDFIELIIKNKDGNKIVIDNRNAQFYSLPWTITYDNKSMDTYNPKISELVRSIIPTEFNNYGKLLGGELIFKLIEEEIVDNLEYKNGH